MRVASLEIVVVEAILIGTDVFVSFRFQGGLGLRKGHANLQARHAERPGQSRMREAGPNQQGQRQ